MTDRQADSLEVLQDSELKISGGKGKVLGGGDVAELMIQYRAQGRERDRL
jgi:hypothetical protein